MTDEAPRSGESAEHFLHRLAGEPGPLSWLDGGSGRGWFAMEADREVEADSLAPLGAIETLWRADPGRVWMGWMTYELGASSLLGRPLARGDLPGLVLRRYAATAELRGTRVHAWHGTADAVARLQTRLATVSASPEDDAERTRSDDAWPFGELQAEIEPADYRSTVERAIGYIAAGDTYQVNLSQPFRAAWRSDAGVPSTGMAAGDTFARLREATPASMGALIEVRPGRWIVSNSPETLLELDLETRRIASWPIKGTRARGDDPVSDAGAAAELLASDKDLAEHIMIVDLVRNDLGRVAEAGSVRVERRAELVSLPTVHHLVSEVSATLPPDWSLARVVEALFPGGSITGAPKLRTMELIAELERTPRSIYCGAILVLAPGGIHVSIPIRTALLSPEGLWLRSGGGVVIDSDPEAERVETLHKARAFRR